MSSAARHPSTEEAEAADSARQPARRRRLGSADGGPGVIGRLASRFGLWWETPAAFDLAVCLVYLSFSFWITRGLWPTPSTRAIADNVNDQALIEWFLSHGVLVWKGDFSLVSDRLNVPDGVNLMSNASHILHGVIMAPVTVLFGAAVSFALLVAVNLAATAAGWYLLLTRTLGLHRGAAMLGGLFAGFAPGMISQSNSHLHMTAQWLVPPIVWCVIRLTRVTTRRAALLTGAGLGVLICAQVLLGEEVLFLTALTLALFAVTYAICRRDFARRVAPRFLAGLGVAALVAVVGLAYPLWVQFRGPQHTPNAPFAPEFFYADIESYALFSPLSIAGSPDAGRLATSSAEYNTYLGLPLLLLVLGCLVWRWRSPATIALAVTGILMTVLSFGPYITLNGVRTGWPSLYSNFSHVPVVNGALPTRYALALIPLIAILVGVTVNAALRSPGFARVAWPLLAVVAILPTMPMPLNATVRQPVPTFVTSGSWRQCAPDGGVIVPVPLPTPQEPDLMRWPAAADAAFAIPEGFFIGPYGPEGTSSIGIYPRPTSLLLAEVARTGVVPAVDDAAREQARADLIYWRADCVALAHVPSEPALRMTLELLLGRAGAPIEDTWTWSVKDGATRD